MTDKDQMQILSRLAFGDLAGAREYANRTFRRKKYKKRHPDAPFCVTCSHKVENNNPFEKKTIVVKIDGKQRQRRIKPLEKYCTNGAFFKLNCNHLRWWGFDRRCPLNPHTHTCKACGQRMCTYDKICSGCKKNMQFL